MAAIEMPPRSRDWHYCPTSLVLGGAKTVVGYSPKTIIRDVHIRGGRAEYKCNEGQNR